MSKIFEAMQRSAAGEAARIFEQAIETGPERPQGESARPKPEAEPEGGPEFRTRRLEARPAGSPLLPYNGARSRAGEQYRIIRTKIVQHPSRPRVLVVSSPGPGDGKTVTSINLAAAMALKTDANVLLVDADFRRSSVAAMLGVEQGPGLAEAIAGGCPIERAAIRAEQFSNLYVLASGQPPANPAELLDSAAWAAAAARFRERFRYVIIDAPPVAAVADYDLIQAACDGVILVIRPDRTRRTLCVRTLEALARDKLIGVVVNCVEDWFLWRTHASYYDYPGQFERPERGSPQVAEEPAGCR